MRYIPALDGVRALAVLMVMFFHLNLPGFSLGWAGVPMFFVLSGYLITNILLDAKQEEFGPYIRHFYLKRTLRIFPLYYAYLLVNAFVMLALRQPLDGYGWYLAYLQNYDMALSRNTHWPGIVGHTWSLAIEEQFYLLWPFLVYFLGRRALLWTCIVCVIAAPLTRLAILETTGNIFMANLTLPSCIDMLAYGALLALIRDSRYAATSVKCLCALGAGLTIFAAVSLGLDAFWTAAGWTRPAFYLYSALAFLCGGLIWQVAVYSDGGLGRLLSLKALVFTGKISYGLYIWHPICFQTVERLIKKGLVPGNVPTKVGLSLAMAFALATVSFYLFEAYFLRLKARLAAHVPSVPLSMGRQTTP